eukprot:CAMPEP_0184649418 /NCGR_PEP_ID=MMETSP0308-20130426/6782_1 /TAXON_ID=38269 /ORGANISM="Gloeochaete witrockiana, Strain SAG 46.84" /LENGTH=866 /DNA_ID=CAMNT_0027082119 /DNA_START=179 /DNA_END=2780 /DNA_ORIENTATION=-
MAVGRFHEVLRWREKKRVSGVTDIQATAFVGGVPNKKSLHASSRALFHPSSQRRAVTISAVVRKVETSQSDEVVQTIGPLYSLATLLSLTGIAAYGAVTMTGDGAPFWLLTSSFASIFGAGGGFLWELSGGLKNPWNRLIQPIRGANVGLVFGANLFIYFSLIQVATGSTAMPDVAALGIPAAAFAVGSFLLLNNFLGRNGKAGLIATVGVSTAIVYGMLSSAATTGTLPIGQIPLAISALCNMMGILAPMRVPREIGSGVMHTFFSLGALLMVQEYIKLSSNDLVQSLWATSPIAAPALAGACLGLFGVLLHEPSRAELRSAFSNTLWSIVHKILYLPAPPINPLTKVSPQKPLETKLYWERHPLALSNSLPSTEIPSEETTGVPYLILGALFKVISVLDESLPCTDTSVPPSKKNRLRATDTPASTWPLLWEFVKPYETYPQVIEAYNTCQLLPYTICHSHGFRDLRPVTAEDKCAVIEANMVLDLQYLEKYEPKEEFEHYGGKAYLVKSKGVDGIDILKLAYITAPFSNEPIYPDPDCPKFRYTERVIHASLMFVNVTHHHLFEVHTMLSAFKVAVHNAFDASQSTLVHPLRAVLNQHFVNQIAVQEITTPHLLDRKGCFSQVFALKFDDMTKSLNDAYVQYQTKGHFMFDLDWDRRRATLNSVETHWETQYYENFNDYAKKVVDIIYKSDEAVKGDKELQNFVKILSKTLGKLPARHVDTLSDGSAQIVSKEQVQTLIADYLFFAIIRHEMLGTTSIGSFIDRRYSGVTQVYKDGGPYAQDDYKMLLLIALATGVTKWPKLDQSLNGLQASVSALSPDLKDHLTKEYSAFLDAMREKDAVLQKAIDSPFLPTYANLEIGPGY